jgi:hypothetical protein
MNKKKIGFWVGFFVLLFAGFYFAMTRLVPGFGEPVLPVLSAVPSFSFDNQEAGRSQTRICREKYMWRNISLLPVKEFVRR